MAPKKTVKAKPARTIAKKPASFYAGVLTIGVVVNDDFVSARAKRVLRKRNGAPTPTSREGKGGAGGLPDPPGR